MGQYNVALGPHQADLISNRDVEPNCSNVGPAPWTTSQHYADRDWVCFGGATLLKNNKLKSLITQ